MSRLERFRRRRKNEVGPPPSTDNIPDLPTVEPRSEVSPDTGDTGPDNPIREALELVDRYIGELRSANPQQFLEHIMEIAPEHLAQEAIQEAIRSRLAKVLDGSLDIGIPLMAFDQEESVPEGETVAEAQEAEVAEGSEEATPSAPKRRCSVRTAVSAIRERFSTQEGRDANADAYYLLRMHLWGSTPKPEMLSSPELVQDLAVAAAKQHEVRKRAARRRAQEAVSVAEESSELIEQQEAVASIDAPKDALPSAVDEALAAGQVQLEEVSQEAAPEVVQYTEGELAELAGIWAPVREMLEAHEDVTAEEWQAYQASMTEQGFSVDEDSPMAAEHRELIASMLESPEGEAMTDEEAAEKVFATLVQTAKETESAQVDQIQLAFLEIETAELTEPIIGYSEDEDEPVIAAADIEDIVADYRESEPAVFVDENINDLTQEGPVFDLVMTRLEPDERREFVQAVIDNHQQLLIRRDFDPTRPWQLRILSIAEQTMSSYGAYKALKARFLEPTQAILNGNSIPASKWELLSAGEREQYTEVTWQGQTVYVEDPAELATGFTKSRPSFSVDEKTGAWKASLYVLDDEIGGMWVEL